MGTKIKWLPAAISDVERLIHFLNTKDRQAAQRAAASILKGCELLGQSPQLGRPLGDERHMRELPVPFGVGAYVIRYKMYNDTVFIVRVWHSREQRL